MKGTLPLSLTQKNKEKLSKAWKTSFQSSFEKFKSFCEKICSSKFLMGEKTNTSFKANISWLFEVQTIERIFANEFDIGDRKTDVQQIAIEKYLAQKAKEAISEQKQIFEKEQAIKDHQAAYRDKIQAFEALSHTEKEKLKSHFEKSEFFQEKITFWKTESEKTALGKLMLENSPLPSFRLQNIAKKK